MRGKWVCELSELAGMGRRETETVKAAITRQVDTYRPPYARRAVDVPRRAVFVGTMNRDDFLQDGTGGRRFLPFRCGVADPRLDVHDEAAARARIGLVWAEIMQAAMSANAHEFIVNLPNGYDTLVGHAGDRTRDKTCPSLYQ